MISRYVLSKLLEIEDLPTLPEVVSRILEAVTDDRSSASDLTEVLECDHAISARVLRLANSAFYGLRCRVDSIRRAVIVIGFDAVRHLALATSVFDMFSKKDQFALDPEDFWLHSLGAAKASQMLCKSHCRVESAGGCFTAGLLHDLGKYVLALALKSEYETVLGGAFAAKGLIKDQELAILKTTHAEVGAWLAGKWRFPNVIADPIEHLYRPLHYSGPNRTEVMLTALSSEISRAANYGNAGDWNQVFFPPELIKALGLTSDIVLKLVESLTEIKEESSLFLSILKGR